MSDISCLHINTINVLHNMHVKEAGLEKGHYILFQHAFFKLKIDNKHVLAAHSTSQPHIAYRSRTQHILAAHSISQLQHIAYPSSTYIVYPSSTWYTQQHIVYSSSTQYILAANSISPLWELFHCAFLTVQILDFRFKSQFWIFLQTLQILKVCRI